METEFEVVLKLRALLKEVEHARRNSAFGIEVSVEIVVDTNDSVECTALTRDNDTRAMAEKMKDKNGG